MSETKHTPTPWRFGSEGVGILDYTKKCAESEVAICGGRYDLTLAVMIGDEVPEQAENAEFIVRACNAHDELAAACAGAAEFLRAYGPPDFDSPLHRVLSALNSALLSAQGR